MARAALSDSRNRLALLSFTINTATELLWHLPSLLEMDSVKVPKLWVTPLHRADTGCITQSKKKKNQPLSSLFAQKWLSYIGNWKISQAQPFKNSPFTEAVNNFCISTSITDVIRWGSLKKSCFS